MESLDFQEEIEIIIPSSKKIINENLEQPVQFMKEIISEDVSLFPEANQMKLEEEKIEPL